MGQNYIRPAAEVPAVYKEVGNWKQAQPNEQNLGGNWWEMFLHQDAEGHLSKLVHLRAGQKPISDARTATYGILSIGSGPGGRRFKSFRPDHYFPSRFNKLRCVFNFGFCFVFTYNTYNIGGFGRIRPRSKPDMVIGNCLKELRIEGTFIRKHRRANRLASVLHFAR